MNSKDIAILKELHKPYIFFWHEWISDSNCNLNVKEIEKIHFYLSKTSKTSLFYEINLYNERKILRTILKKLEIGYPVFKEFIVYHFLTTIIRIAKEYGYDEFLHTPISQLKIDTTTKEALLKFRSLTMWHFCTRLKEEEFSRGWIYIQIVEFLKFYKTKLSQSATILNLKNQIQLKINQKKPIS